MHIPVPAPARRPAYAAVLLTPHAPRLFAAALLGRLAYGTVFLSLILALTRATGSYATAGAIMAAFGAAVPVFSPARARLIDRFAPRRALPPLAATHAALLAALAALTWRPGAPAAPLCALAVAAGACAPPLGPVMRALWSDLVPDPRLRRRAFSLDTVAEELLYVTGPLLAGLLAVLAAPALGVAVSAALLLAGSLALATSPFEGVRRPTPAPDGRAGPRTGPGRPRTVAGLGRPMTVSAAVGLSLGAVNLLVVAFAEHHHRPAAVAWIEAALAAGSAAGGLVYGAVAWRAPARLRLPALAAALGAALAAAGLAPGVPALTLAAGAAGLFVAPALTTAYLLADEAAAPHARVRAGSWVNTAFNTGTAAGTAGAGVLVGALPLPACFLLAAAAPLAAALAAPVSRLRGSAP